MAFSFGIAVRRILDGIALQETELQQNRLEIKQLPSL
jgi:hypothetical protein